MRAVLACISLIAVSGAVAFGQATGSANLTGKMAPFTYLLGSPWKCTTNVPAMMGKPAHTETATATFDTQPNNVMHLHVAGGDYLSDQYLGYSTQANAYWSSSSDSAGIAVSEQSADGKAYRGIAALAGMSGTAQDTYTRVGDNHVKAHSVTTLGGQTTTTDSDCVK